MNTPLTLPDPYNPETHLLKNITENGIFHESRKGAAFAASLVANGTKQDLALAEQVLDVVLSCQEHNPDDPHAGNFYWMFEDDTVQDLNAVEFCLEHLIPMMLQHSDRLAATTQDKTLDAIRFGLKEIARLDVLVAYTNICLLDIVNTCLGGELLQDEQIKARGRQKLKDWMTFTDSNGTAFEHNSPTYTNVCIKALHRLASYSKHEETQIRARTSSAQLGLSAALHIHKDTGRWAGPHSRAYHPSILCETPAELELLKTWLSNAAIPDWLEDILEASPTHFEITETASSDSQIGLTTYQAPDYALGVSSKEYSGQSNVLMLHYSCQTADKPGVLYTRYLMNEKWLGDFYHATDRTKSRNIIDEGQFFGVQQGNKAIGLYTIASPAVMHSAKLCLILLGAHKVDEVWLGDTRISEKTFETLDDELVILKSGEVFIAIKPLTRTSLGKTAPMKLVEREGDLVLELYNYQGTAKSFWELNWPGFFYKGKPQCGFYVEVASKKDYADANAFARAILAGKLKDSTQDAFNFSGQEERLWTVSYERDDITLGIEIDVMQWQLKRRWNKIGELGWPMLESPMAKQTTSGLVECNGAKLECNPVSAWLYANPETDTYAAGYHGTEAGPIKLSMPRAEIQIASMGLGTLVYQNGQLKVDALEVNNIQIYPKGKV